ncbi:M14 family metallopeptidase [Desulfolutivibrio sulfoxidireducens]|uniref:M14 family metallopeptidase n=1 Tax=Desulfolutivibrio sulfoxidireducens TaxID=2773299 RepID=UPI00159D2A5A|nr:M14 family metallopeptidase [Desulfolutivibrio sulfoxidireducens]QLA18624.1 deacylase [Desulfolutivibrio sulfoxidireducens]
MKTTLLTVWALLALVLASPVQAGLDFTLHKLDSGKPGKTLLVVGGIQGDEPGGFTTAALIISHYKITSGSVWVVPNLNFPSIIQNSRGIYGDMNRKFEDLDPSDPEYETVAKIKKIITDERVDLIAHLHDGSGFYRPQRQDPLRCPERWGQCVVIDEERTDEPRYIELAAMASRVVERVNEGLYDPEHAYHVKNTLTRRKDTVMAKEMAKTLTYYAINNGKPAFGIEASKEFPTAMRSYYQLRAIEGFMDILGIGYERRFPMTAEGVDRAANSNVALSFFNNKIFLDLADARDRLGFFPFKKDAAVEYVPSNPLMAVVGAKNAYRIYYGNRNLTELVPEYFEYDDSEHDLTLLVDGGTVTVPFGRIISVGRSFEVAGKPDCRVNIIGYSRPGAASEEGISVRREDVSSRFSVDRAGRVYRVELYKKDKFAGMVLVRFQDGGKDLRMAGQTDKTPESRINLFERATAEPPTGASR